MKGRNMEEKKYLKNWQKVLYSSGDFGSNYVYGFVSSFILIYLTDTVGLNAGIVGTLILASKCLDGVSDVIFGNLLDRTKTKYGKARPWYFWSMFPMALCEILLFMMPSASETLQYGYFFVTYSLLNAVCYTANNIAYTSMTSFITKNSNERVQLGSMRFIFNLSASVLISAGTVSLVSMLGGGAAGWRGTAILYAVIMIIFTVISVSCVRELPEAELAGEEETVLSQEKKEEARLSIGESVKYLVTNRYYMLILFCYIVKNIGQGAITSVGAYFCAYVMGNSSYLGLFTAANMVPTILGLSVVPLLVKRFGIYRVNVAGTCISLLFAFPVMIMGYMGNLPGMLFFFCIKSLGDAPILGTTYTIIADTGLYIYRTRKIHMEGTLYSCTSVGKKVGSGLSSAISGWLLAAVGYDGTALVKTAASLNMIRFMYLWIPIFCAAIMVFIALGLNVQRANKMLEGGE